VRVPGSVPCRRIAVHSVGSLEPISASGFPKPLDPVTQACNGPTKQFREFFETDTFHASAPLGWVIRSNFDNFICAFEE
jgi:hypothetical protein